MTDALLKQDGAATIPVGLSAITACFADDHRWKEHHFDDSAQVEVNDLLKSSSCCNLTSEYTCSSKTYWRKVQGIKEQQIVST